MDGARRVTAADLTRGIDENIRFDDITFVVVGATDLPGQPLSRLADVEARKVGNAGDRD
jgi:hypothetical protein